MAHHFFTSESVTEGHPDKICDQISDAILNEILTQDPYARVACETTCTTGMVQVMGEISTSCYVDIPKVVRDTVREIGYDRAKYGFDCDTCAVLTAIDEQSADIALGVDNSLERKEGASEADLAIGVAEPVSIMVETFGTGVVGDDVLEKAVEKVFDLRPAAIIEQLDLRKPIYKQLAAYGHMGREELGVKWENTDKVEALKAAVNG